MYTEFFHLKEMPFSIAPDPRFFFMSDRHKEALTHLTYGLQGAGGFVMLTGEVGTGKTTVSRALAQSLTSDKVVGYIHNPVMNEVELLATLCDEFKLNYDKHDLHLKQLFDLLHHYLLDNCQREKSCVVIIDEAQLLSTPVLEQLRLLTNLDVDHKKLLHIVLIGQPELQQKLKQAELRQLAQRITARYHLLPLTESELASYVAYRLSIASGNPGLFNHKILKRIHRHTSGIPRLVNLVCDKALYYAFKSGANKITLQHVETAVKAVVVTEPNKVKTTKSGLYALAAAMLLVASGIAAFQLGGVNFMLDKVITKQADKPHVIVASSETELIEDNSNHGLEPVVMNVISDRALFAEIKSARKPATATQFLYKRWGYDIALADANCRNTRYTNLRCLPRQGNYGQLVQYNLPAVVRLLDNLGEGYYATLLSISPAGVELQLNGSHILASQAWFEKYWSGDFSLFWTAPRRFKNSLKQHDQGELVRWLDRNVSAALGEVASSGRTFDLALTNKVMRLQQQSGLTADGIVGPQTMMMIVHHADSTVPKLSVTENINVGVEQTDPKTIVRLAAIEFEQPLTAITIPTQAAKISNSSLNSATKIIPTTTKAYQPKAPAANSEKLLTMNEQLANEQVSAELLAKFNRALTATSDGNNIPSKKLEESYNAVPIADLPPHLLVQIPNIIYSSHVYSSKSNNRSVRLNNRDLREGSWLSDDVEILEILQNEVIMRVGAQSFSLQALSDWSA